MSSTSVNAWLPKSILLLRDYDRHKFLSDLLAGVAVGLVASPLAMAFAIASDFSPTKPAKGQFSRDTRSGN